MNTTTNETALQELHLVKRELEAIRDEKHALRCYLKAAEKQAEEACKKADFYMDEVIILRAENEALKSEIEKVTQIAKEEAKRAGIEHLGAHAEIVSENEPCIDVRIVKAQKTAKGE